MTFRFLAASTAILLAGLTAGCANDGGLLAGSLTTASVPDAPAAQVAAAPKVDPQCFALMSKIDQLRKEGTPARIEKVATTGKGSTASVKRDSLAKMTELDKANAEFQVRCSKLAPSQAAAAASPAPATAVPATATQTVAKASTKTAASKPVAQ
ncbi:MAG: hypothetical protein JNM89_08015 [Hyphomicrobiaceae bacterium]|nr:hypothetical protein [Hyphomicrobiaceae bacterium]